MNKYVLITGAYGGLGKALAKIYAQNHYNLILTGRNKQKLEIIKDQLPKQNNIICLTCDVSQYKQCKQVYENLQAQKINISILINNAGITYIQAFNDDYEIEQYQNVINTNLNGSVHMSKLFINDIISNKGHIINLSSVIGYAPVLWRTAYATSKFGMEGFFNVLDAELNRKAHIMMVYPTFIATEIRKDVKGKKEVNEILTAQYVAKEIYQAMLKRKKRLYLGKTAWLSKIMYKYFPKIYVHLMRKKILETT